LLERIKAPGMTVRALTLELRDRGAVVDHVSVWRLLKGSGFSFKKTLFASEHDRPAVARRREQCRKYQDRVDPRRLVFTDETWAKTNMTPLRGWDRAATGSLPRPHGRWRTLTFLAALRHNRIDALCVIDGPINGDRFIAYVEQLLIPTLTPGDIVVMDNLGSQPQAPGRAQRDPCRRCKALLPAPL
jgi:hypothetical protein